MKPRKRRKPTRTRRGFDYRKVAQKKARKNPLLGGLKRIFKDVNKQTKASSLKKQKHRTSPKQRSENGKKTGKPIYAKILLILLLPIILLLKAFHELIKYGEEKLGREWLIKVTVVGVFVVIIINFVNLQVTGEESGNNVNLVNTEIIPAKRGEIYIKDIKLNNKDFAVTSSELLSTISIDPDYLKKHIRNGNFTKEEIVTILSSSLNLPWNEVNDFITSEIEQEKPRSFAILEKYATKEQGEIVEKLRNEEPKNSEINYKYWLNYNDIEMRSYPEEKMLASTIGYVQKTKIPRDDALKISGCEDMIRQNERRLTYNSYTGEKEDAEYTVGYYGLEEKFCSILGGLNGREMLSNEIGTEKAEDSKVVNGADIFLTIDRNIQRKAEEILKQAVKDNTNDQGGPKNGTILVVNLEDTEFADAGAILAMASYPFADPNEYYKPNYISGFTNAATNIDYEAGSVIKPLTVASALNEWFSGQVDEDGERTGLDPNWQFQGYDYRGKPYQERNGNIVYIKNAGNKSYGVSSLWPIKDCLRLSINTCLSDIEPQIGNSAKTIEKDKGLDHTKTRNYFEERFLFGKETLVDLPGETHGYMNPNPLQVDIGIDFSYASFAFGQGFRTSPLQIARAYTAIARKDGTLVEPYLVEKIVYENGTEDDGKSNDSLELVKRSNPTPTLDPQASNLVSDWLVYTLDSYKTVQRGKVPGYPIAAKTGTAQVSRMDSYNQGKCVAGESIQDCNTRLGIYDQTFVGYGPVGNEYDNYPKILVLVKLSEPKPGESNSYAVNNLGQAFSSTMSYSLEYLGIPKNR